MASGQNPLFCQTSPPEARSQQQVPTSLDVNDALSARNYEVWRKRPLAAMEEAGQHEMLNWCALMGAMEHLDRRPVVQDYVETHIFMSEKCFVAYPA